MMSSPCGKMFEGDGPAVRGHAENCDYCRAWFDGFQAALKERQGYSAR